MVFLDKGRIESYIHSIGGDVWQQQRVRRFNVQSAVVTFESRRCVPQPRNIAQRDVNTTTAKQQQGLQRSAGFVGTNFRRGKPMTMIFVPMIVRGRAAYEKSKDFALTAANRLRLSDQKMTFAARGNAVLRDLKQKFGQLGQSNFGSAMSVVRSSGVSLLKFFDAVENSVRIVVMGWLNDLSFRHRLPDFTTQLIGMRFGRPFLSATVVLARNAVSGVEACTFTTSWRNATAVARS